VNSDRSFTGICGSFAEYRVSACRIAPKIPSLKETQLSPTEIVMKNLNTLSSKLTAFAAALAMNALVLGGLGYLFALQSHPNISAIAFAKTIVAHQWLS
jgi:hypothetical protein